MPSPFPGMDPYIEATGIWSGFHHAFITACNELLNDLLPADYVAAIEERVLLIGSEDSDDTRSLVEPDVAVLHTAAPVRAKPDAAAEVATLEPSTLPQEIEVVDPPKQAYIEVLHLPNRKLVTDVELLSPANKRRGGVDRTTYLGRRRDLIFHEVNLVELDLLSAGERLPLLAPLPPGDYYAFVTRWLTGRQCDVFAWSVRQPLPTIPVPLKEEDGAVGLDLGAAFSRVCERGRYDRLLRYDEPLALLSPADRQWASQRLSENVR